MAGTKEIKTHIDSVKDTKKITNAMYLIASTKLRKARSDLDSVRPYFDALRAEIKRIFRTAGDVESPYFYPYDHDVHPLDGTFGCLVITADKGLAGAYNQNVLKEAEKMLAEHPDTKLYVVGEYGRHFFAQKGIPIEKSFLYTAQNPTMDRAREISSILLDAYDKGTLKKGWNHLEIALGDAVRTGAHWVKFNIGTDAKHDYTVLFDNIYATKADIKFNITTSGNVAKVVGPITAANVKQINNVNAMNIDLRGVSSIEEGVTLQPLRKNAIIVISGTYKEETIDEKKVCTTTADSKFDAIKDKKNFVVLAADGYYHPLKQLEFVDIPGEPFWTGGLRDLNDFISTGDTGWKVTRTIKAGDHASICVPFAITSIPEGLYVWEATNYDTKNNIINFSKAVEVPGNFPCILRNTTDQDIKLNWTWTGDINFGNYVGKDANTRKLGNTNVYFCGNWKEVLVTDGNQWILQNDGINASIVKANGTKISPFRAYFTGIPQGAPAKLNFDDKETTGITNVNAAESNDDTLYNLAGQKVNAAYKGIVIKNGKKYLVK